eukprot:jgi/Mesvir1/9334/Mv03621-RA.1
MCQESNEPIISSVVPHAFGQPDLMPLSGLLCAVVLPASASPMPHDKTLEGGARSPVHLDRVRLLVVTSEGYFYDYSVELHVNGASAEGCKGYSLEQERVLIQSASEEISVRRLG